MTNKTIAAGNVVLKMKADGVLAEANRIKNEMRAIRTVIKQSTPDTTRYATETKALADAFKRGDINGGQFARSQEFLAQKYKVVTQAQKESIALTEKEAAIRAKFAQKANLDAAWKNAGGAVGISQITKQAQMQKEAVDRLNTAWRNAPVGVAQLTKQAQMQKDSVDRLNAAWAKASSVMGSSELTKVASAARAAYGELVMIHKLQQNMASQKPPALFAMLGAARGGASIAGGVGIGALAMMSKSAVELAVNAEKASIQYGVLLGNMEEGKQLAEQMRSMSNTLPVRLDDLQVGSRTLLSFGAAGESIIPILKQIGDITAGDSMRFQMLSLALAQSNAAGRLMGQDLLQMVNAGFNPLKEISEKTGLSLIDLKKRMEEGGISSKLVGLAFESATSEGGRFFGMLEAQKDTLAGQYTQLKADVREIGLSIGKDMLPLMQQVVETAKRFTTEMNNSKSQVGGLIHGLQVELALFNDVLDSVEAGGVVKVDNMNKLINAGADAENRRWSRFEAEFKARKQRQAEEKKHQEEMTAEEARRKQMLDELNGPGGFITQGMNQMLESSKSIKYVWDQMLKDAELTKKQVDDIRNRANPDLKIQQEAGNINSLLQKGLITNLEADKVLADLASQMQGSKGSDGPRSPSLINADSSEAYNWVMNQQAQVQKLEEQKRIQAQQLQALKDIAKNTENTPILGVAG